MQFWFRDAYLQENFRNWYLSKPHAFIIGDGVDMLEFYFPLLRQTKKEINNQLTLKKRDVTVVWIWSFEKCWYLGFLVVLFFKSCIGKIRGRDLMFCFKEEIGQSKRISTANKISDLWSQTHNCTGKGCCCFHDNIISSGSGRATEQ